MSNIIAGIVRGQIPYLEEHMARKKAIYECYKVGLADLPVKMNPFDAEKSEPIFWLSCMIIDEDAMCGTVRGEQDVLYVVEPGKSCPTEILEAMAAFWRGTSDLEADAHAAYLSEPRLCDSRR